MEGSAHLSQFRITPDELSFRGARFVLDKLREAAKGRGYYITNTERDLSQSDFKNRIMPHTQMLVAEERNESGFFSLEITGGASVHVDMLRKQINPLEKLEILREKMPDLLFQTLCRGINLFGYRPYPENVVRLTVKSFARYVHVWRVFDFLNHIPNMIPVYEEVKRAGCLLEPAICFSTGPEHTDAFYVKKVEEILGVTGEDVVLCIKNHGGLGSSDRIGRLVRAILTRFPDLVIHYHGHNTDGADVSRAVAAVQNGAIVVDASDHAMTGFYGPPPILSIIQELSDLGYEARGIDVKPIIAASSKLRSERPFYRDFESQFFGFDPTAQRHKLPGGATGSSFEQAVNGGFLHRMPEILQNELPRVQIELGNWWSVTPGSQILWTTALTNVLEGQRYKKASDDLKKLLLGRYGEFPFRFPDDDVYEAVFGGDWRRIKENEYGYQEIEDVSIETESKVLEKRLGHPVTDDELVLCLQHPNDAVNFFKYEAKHGKTWVLSPSVWFRKGGFKLGEKLEFTDCRGRSHTIEMGPQRKNKDGDVITYLVVDHHVEPFLTATEENLSAVKKVSISAKEINDLAQKGDVRAHVKGTVNEVPLKEGERVSKGQILIVLEAMKMLNNVLAEIDGQVSEIIVSVGDSVDVGDRLLGIKKE